MGHEGDAQTHRPVGDVPPVVEGLGGAAEADPFNRLFARGPRFRLDAETVRDNALAISGLLNRKIGGPSVFPYQPDGIWFNPYSGDRWVTSRTATSIAEACTRSPGGRPRMRSSWRSTPRAGRSAERRPRTNTPLRPWRCSTRRCSSRRRRPWRGDGVGGGRRSRDRVAYGFRLCVARTPTAAERELLLNYTASRWRNTARTWRRRAMVKNGGAAPKGVDPAELAAWTVVANVLLNLDETITKG